MSEDPSELGRGDQKKIRTALAGDMPTAVNAMTDSYLFSSA